MNLLEAFLWQLCFTSYSLPMSSVEWGVGSQHWDHKRQEHKQDHSHIVHHQDKPSLPGPVFGLATFVNVLCVLKLLFHHPEPPFMLVITFVIMCLSFTTSAAACIIGPTTAVCALCSRPAAALDTQLQGVTVHRCLRVCFLCRIPIFFDHLLEDPPQPVTRPIITR